jgi:signal transduction histidine kinase
MQEEQIDALKKIDKNSKRLLELINAMLDVSSLEAGTMEVKEVDIDLLLTEVKEEIRADADKRGLSVTWKAEPGLHMRTDPARLKVIMKNIIGNAVKFTEKGGVTIDLHAWNRGIKFDVTDTGMGIALEDMKIIFEPFRQVENPLTRRHGGAGLGLYMVKRLLELLGGTITVESELGRGSTFRVRIPTGKGYIERV